MKKLLLIALLCIGCGSSPNFAEEKKVISVAMFNNEIIKYTLEGEAANGFSNPCFFAPRNLAEVGDSIIIIDGELQVIKPK